jgi:transcriptional regulator with XRE-family HTH domain
MSIGFKIKKLRETKNMSQPKLADELHISQSELSKIESGKTKKVDFAFMSSVCDFFEKDFEFFTENYSQTNNIKKLEGCVNNHGTINMSPENIINELKNLFAENVD